MKKLLVLLVVVSLPLAVNADEIRHFDSPNAASPIGLVWDDAGGYMWHVDQGNATSGIGSDFSSVFTILPDGTATLRCNLQDIVETDPDFGEWTSGNAWAVGGNGCALDTTNNYLYIVDYVGDNMTEFGDSVYTLDVSTPSSPTLVDWYDFETVDRITACGIKDGNIYLGFGLESGAEFDRGIYEFTGDDFASGAINNWDYPIDGDYTGDIDWDASTQRWYVSAKLSTDVVLCDSNFNEKQRFDYSDWGAIEECIGVGVGEDGAKGRAVWITSREYSGGNPTHLGGEIWLFDDFYVTIESASLGTIKASFK